MELIFLSLDRTLVGQRLEQLKEKSINQIQITLTMSLVNVNEISMVTIDNLITTAIKDISIKKKGHTSITTNAFINKTRNDSIQPEIIKEGIECLTKMRH